MKQGPMVDPDSSTPAGHTTVPSPSSCCATCQSARGPRSSMNSSVPLRTKNRWPLPPKNERPPSTVTGNAAASSSVMGVQVEGSSRFMPGRFRASASHIASRARRHSSGSSADGNSTKPSRLNWAIWLSVRSGTCGTLSDGAVGRAGGGSILGTLGESVIM